MAGDVEDRAQEILAQPRESARRALEEPPPRGPVLNQAVGGLGERADEDRRVAAVERMG